MHGPGTLILKDKEESHLKGNWEKGKCTQHDLQIQEFEKQWELEKN